MVNVKKQNLFESTNLPTSIWVEFWMLSISQINFVLLLGSGVKTKVRLFREIIDREDEADDARFRNKSLRLFNFSTKLARFSPITQPTLSIPIYDLWIESTKTYVYLLFAWGIE